MSESAFQIQYRQEFVQGFEQLQTLVRPTTTTEAVIKGQQATFLVADSGGASAVTRGLNGLIPGRANNLNQKTATLAEWHDKPQETGFNIFASQGDQRRIMQIGAAAVINRKIDQDIIGELNGGSVTNNTGAAQQASLDLVMYGLAILGNNAIPMDGNISCLITPAFWAYLMQTKEYASFDFTNNKPFTNQPMTFRWANINFIVHPNLPGKGTAAEKCFLYHKSAIGHAMDVEGMKMTVDYNREHNYSYALCSVFMGPKLLQASGAVVINHDGSGYASA